MRTLSLMGSLVLTLGMSLISCNQSSSSDAQEAPAQKDPENIFNSLEISKFAFEDNVHAVAFSPNGEFVAGGATGDRISVKVMNVKTGAVDFEAFHSRRVLSVAFSADSRFLATGSGDSNDTNVRVMDLQTKKQVLVMPLGGSVNAVAFDPSGKYLVTGSSDQTLQIIDMAAQKTVRTLKGYYPVSSLAFSSDGQYLAWAEEALQSYSDDPVPKYVRILNFNDLNNPNLILEIPLTSIRNPDKSPYQNMVSFQPGNSVFAVASNDGTLRTFDVTTGKELAVNKNSFEITSMAFSPSGQHLAIVNDKTQGNSHHTINFMDGNTLGFISQITLSNIARGLTFSPDGEFVAVGCGDRNIHLYKIRP